MMVVCSCRSCPRRPKNPPVELLTGVVGKSEDFAGSCPLRRQPRSANRCVPDLDPRPLEDVEANQSIEFRCLRQERCCGLMLLGQDELKDMLEKDARAELTCHFATQYQVVPMNCGS